MQDSSPYIDGVSRVDISIPERTVNVAYDSQITDAYVIQTLLKAGYKTIEEPEKILNARQSEKSG